MSDKYNKDTVVVDNELYGTGRESSTEYFVECEAKKNYCLLPEYDRDKKEHTVSNYSRDKESVSLIKDDYGKRKKRVIKFSFKSE